MVTFGGFPRAPIVVTPDAALICRRSVQGKLSVVGRRSEDMARRSLHVEPAGPLQIARHYIRELIYGANDGIITTFAVVAGVTGGGLSLPVVLIIGAANLFADGLSMAVGNYLSIRSHESVLEAQDLPEEESSPVRHAIATFIAFVVAGTVPLVPYMFTAGGSDRFLLSLAFTMSAMFGVGASRALIANVRWWKAGVEMLSLGAVVAVVAYASGRVVALFVNGT
jgi:vacuolar iron transporter family protein